MVETFLLRVYYLNDFDDIDCKTCLFIPMQSRNNDKMLQLRVQCSIYNHEHDALLRCMMQGWGWGIPCTTKMMHMTQCNYHDVDQMMHTPWCKDDDTCNVCTYENA
jgi:hypothetical protein